MASLAGSALGAGTLNGFAGFAGVWLASFEPEPVWLRSVNSFLSGFFPKWLEYPLDTPEVEVLMFLMTITSPKNHQNIESIRLQHVLLSDPQKSGSLNLKDMPAS